MLPRRLFYTSFCHVRNFLFCSSYGTHTQFRNFSVSKHLPQSMLFEPLKHRHVLKISGPHADEFLQGMITNDIQHFHNFEKHDVFSPCMYSMLLCAKGRVLYDTLLYKVAEGDYLLEYDAAALLNIKKHLQMYRLRKKVSIEPANTMHVLVIFSFEEMLPSVELVAHFKTKDNVIAAVKDPRVPQLGYRIIVEDSIDFKMLAVDLPLNVAQNASYDVMRYKLGIGEGVRDHPPGACFPIECNIDFLHGVSFQKGCYIGQEHTARVRYTGVVRKRLMPVKISSQEIRDLPADCTIINGKGTKMGKLRSSVGLHGLAILNVEESLKSEVLTLAGYDIEVKVTKPSWWPQNLDKRGFPDVTI